MQISNKRGLAVRLFRWADIEGILVSKELVHSLRYILGLGKIRTRSTVDFPKRNTVKMS